MDRKIILITLTIGIFLFPPLSASMEAQAMDSQKGDLDIVMELIEGWKKEMEQRGLEHYLSRYGDPSQKAVSSKGKKGHSQPVDIAIEDVRVFKRDDGTITTTFLRRANSGQFQDVGVGMLSFKREGARWKIDQEDWYSLSEDGSSEGMAYTVTIGPGNAPRVIIHSAAGKGNSTGRTPEEKVPVRKTPVEKFALPKTPEKKGTTSERKVATPEKKVVTSEKKVATPEKRVAVRKEVSVNPDVGEYTIGAGDIIIISVWGHGDLTKEVVVSEKGTFSFPLIGEVKASGLTVNGLEAKLVELLSNGYVINPNVSVRIQGYQSKTVYVLGQVRSPGSYSLHKETSLIEIISRAGGVTDNAGWIIEVVRPSERSLDKPVIPDEAKKEEIIRVDVEGLLGGRPEDNIRIEGGDTIFIPPAAYYYIFGEVKRPGSYKLMRDTTILKAVILAGGFTEKASKRRIKIRREKGGETIKVRVKLDDPVLPQDTIIVPESFF
jgi:polysaccharide export outer membrane protein